VDDWKLRQFDWLDAIENDPDQLPFGMNVWQVMEQEFRKFFADYAERERAQEELVKLKMESGKIDDFIAAFSKLAHQAGMDLDEPFVLKTFAQGLPASLADHCIDINNPTNFDEWVKAALNGNRAFLQKRALRGMRPTNQQPQGNRQGFFWRSNQNQRSQGQSRVPPRLPPRDPNAMDTSASAQLSKATTEAEKERYKKEGRCFECGKQGHIVRACPTRQARQNATSARSTSVIVTDPISDSPEPPAFERIGKALLGFSDEDRQGFLEFMSKQGEDMGFGSA
jgi:hypothetical protein